MTREEREARLTQKLTTLMEMRSVNPKFPCPECGTDMILRYSSKTDGYFYGCGSYPECTSTHGCDQTTGRPLGVPADAETRQWRVLAHAEFDKLWSGLPPKMSRKEAYRVGAWLMGLEAGKMHIAMLNEEQCIRLINEVQALLLQPPDVLVATLNVLSEQRRFRRPMVEPDPQTVFVEANGAPIPPPGTAEARERASREPPVFIQEVEIRTRPQHTIAAPRPARPAEPEEPKKPKNNFGRKIEV